MLEALRGLFDARGFVKQSVRLTDDGESLRIEKIKESRALEWKTNQKPKPTLSKLGGFMRRLGFNLTTEILHD